MYTYVTVGGDDKIVDMRLVYTKATKLTRTVSYNNISVVCHWYLINNWFVFVLVSLLSAIIYIQLFSNGRITEKVD